MGKKQINVRVDQDEYDVIAERATIPAGAGNTASVRAARLPSEGEVVLGLLHAVATMHNLALTG
ncbi:hypothetical protein [Streptomyces collinus]|uniref:hypothetical protein n=1 Tax=Streptomyces collinus TaxID=42684 RepID=UPI003325E313